MNTLRTAWPLAVAFVSFALTPWATAQPVTSNYYGPYYHPPYATHRHASTLQEGILRGRADVIRSQGEANLLHSQAALNYQEAYSRQLDNKVKRVDTYWSARSVYDRNRAIQDRERLEKTARKLAKSRLEPLEVHEFDPTTGMVYWPALLQSPEFAPYRMRLDVLLQKRSVYGTLSADDSAEIANLILNWRSRITDVKSDYSIETVRSSLRFLVRLNRELRDSTI